MGPVPPTADTVPHRAGIAALWHRSDNIHNPVLRVLSKVGTGILGVADRAGQVVAPGFEAAIPGSTVNRAIQVRNQQKQETVDAANKEKESQAEEASARANAIRNPQPKEGLTPEETTIHDLMTGENGQPRMNPETQKPYNYLEAFQAVKQAGQDVKPDKTANEGKTVQVGDEVRQWNPETKRYDIPVGPAKEGKKTPAHVTYDQGIPVSVTDEKGSVFDVNDPKLPPELQPLVKSATRAHGQHVSEDANKQAAAFAQQQKMHDEKQNDLTAATKSMVEAAPGVLALTSRVRQLVDAQEKSLGPAAGRWSEFMAGSVGAENPEFTKLRTSVGLLTTKLMRMHVGARGGELMMQHFKDLIDAGKQSPANLRAALEEIEQYAHEVQSEGKGGGSASPAAAGNAPPPGAKVRDYSELGK
jgi:hypothetical protein